jgi:hypothetical protein
MSDLIFEVIQLRAEVKLLRAEVRDVRNSLIFESKSTTTIFKKVWAAFDQIDDRLDPLWRKVFSAPVSAGEGDGAESLPPG